jgi:hypothetical protein
MENIQEQDQCQHPGCKCARPSSGDHCSEQCRIAEEGGSGGECVCGHAEYGSGGG